MSGQRSVVVWRPGDGPWATLGQAAAGAGRADLAVLMPGVVVFGDWLERLGAAAYWDTTIATASAMLSGDRWAPSPLPAAEDLESAAAAVAEWSLRRRPRVGEPLAGCVLVRRSALDLIGAGDWASTSAAAGLADFAQRCSAVGLGHVLADDVLARGDAAVPTPAEEAMLDARYPHRQRARELDARYPHRESARELDGGADSPLGHAVLAASRGLDKLSVTIDGRSLGLARAGTQVHALELIAALGRTGRVTLRVLTPPDLDADAARAFAAIKDLTELPYATAAAAVSGAQDGGAELGQTDIVHRPSQVFSASDLTLLLPLGRRIVVTHQDLIAYRIAGYHDSVEHWERYRRITRDTLAGADHVVFFSEHARADALSDDLVDPSVASVVPIGIDHHLLATRGRVGERPAALPEDGVAFLLCLGADLRHKNQAFALELAAALRSDQGWRGRVVFAGPTGSIGAAASGEEDAELVVRLGAVSEEEKTWLLQRAAAVVYPTTYEGFGLLPFEAGAAGTPCVFARQTSLAEILPERAATLVAWDARASAAAAAPLLEAGAAREAHVALLREAGERYRWDETAAALVELYEEVLVARPRGLRQAARERLFLEQRLEQTEELRQEEWRRGLAFREQIGSDGLGLVGPGGVLARRDQRALLALLSKRVVRRPAMWLARAAYRVASVGRRRA
jgi:glycosyltransferase involved in cell wall biosynthesis